MFSTISQEELESRTPFKRIVKRKDNFTKKKKLSRKLHCSKNKCRLLFNKINKTYFVNTWFSKRSHYSVEEFPFFIDACCLKKTAFQHFAYSFSIKNFNMQEKFYKYLLVAFFFLILFLCLFIRKSATCFEKRMTNKSI